MRHSLLLLITFILNTAVTPQNQLLIPDTLSGSTINLTLQHGSVSFFPGAPTETMGANGSILGPTLILNKGEEVLINVTNHLMEMTTIHWHGLHVSPRNDGGPHVVIEPDSVWSPGFTVLDQASTYWYHPHLHHHTNEQVAKGLAGFIIVRDEEEGNLLLPRTYGVDDLPLVVQTKSFDAGNQIITENAFDTTVMVNATINAHKDLPAQVVRLRLLNGSAERSFNFGFSNNISFFQIASDGGLLQAPVQMTRLLLAPGERAEILVNLSALTGQTIRLMNYGTEIPNGIYGAAQPGIGPGQVIPGYSSNPLNGSNYSILTINITDPSPSPVTSVPTVLSVHSPWSVTDADTSRSFVFTTAAGPGGILGPFRINGSFFDMEVINEYVPFNNIEIWEIRNQTPIAHPFHIHGVQFYIIDINGAPPPANLSGRKDVILVRGGNTVVRFITKFETFYDDMYPFMYHCHMLTHEDEGMMGQFIVMEPDPVPVELKSFYASVSGNDVQLNWITSSELNNDGFMIEKKSDEWNVLSFVEGSGNSSIQVAYTYTDVNAGKGKHYYRLKQMDYDGTYKYSDVLEVTVGTITGYDLSQNYPNPFNPVTSIVFNIPEKETVTLKVFDVFGSEIKTLLNQNMEPGRHEVGFDASQLASGFYFYRITAGSFIQTRKMLLLK